MRQERRRCIDLLTFLAATHTSTDATATEQVMPFHRRMPKQGRIMPTTISPSAVATAALNASTTAPVLPEIGFVRQPLVLALVPFSKSTLWRRVQARTFPAPLKLSPGVTVWRAEDIRQWITQQSCS